jgi:hypothetical protein
VELPDLADECGLGAHHVGESLARLGMRAEHDEIDRMAVVQRDADLTVGLEAADARAMAGPGVDDHIGTLPVLHLDAAGRQDLEQHLVGRARQRLAVEDDLVVVDEHRRRAGLLMRLVLLSPFAQDVERERVALLRVDGVGLGVVAQNALVLGHGKAPLKVGRVGPELMQPLAVVVRRALDAPAEGEHDLFELATGLRGVLRHALGAGSGATGRGHGACLD